MFFKSLAKAAIAAAVLTALTGCDGKGGSGSGHGGSQSDRANGVAGIDKDNNGIRDDIDEYIELEYADEKQKKAARQFARSAQEELLVDPADKKAVAEVDERSAKALICFLDTLEANSSSKNSRIALQKIESMTLNTDERLFRYFKYNKALDGSTWTLPEWNTCDE